MIKQPKLAKIIRWSARSLGTLIIALFLVIGVGEIMAAPLNNLSTQEYTLFIFIPILLFTGIILAWIRPVLGGYVVIASVLLFNICDLIFGSNAFLDLEFGWLVVLGLMYIISSEKA